MFESPAAVVAEDQKRCLKAPETTVSVIQAIPLYVLGSRCNTTWF